VVGSPLAMTARTITSKENGMATFDSIKRAAGILMREERNLRKVAGVITLIAL
jgi:hypothetical protein